MKVGLIVECAPQGLEHVVCPKILKLLEAECKVEIKCVIRAMAGKDSLILDCAATTRGLFSDGCDRVVIVWDENPPWTEDKDYAKDRCWHIEREGIKARLLAEKVTPMANVGLVCIERGFETILMHDTDLIRAVVSPGKEHPVKIKRIEPLEIDDPTGWMERQFRKHKSGYNKAVVAKKFAANLNSLDGIKRCDIFRHLVEKILGKMPQGWEPYIYVPRGPKR